MFEIQIWLAFLAVPKLTIKVKDIFIFDYLLVAFFFPKMYKRILIDWAGKLLGWDASDLDLFPHS